MSHVRSDSFSGPKRDNPMQEGPKGPGRMAVCLGEGSCFQKKQRPTMLRLFEANQKMEALDWIKAKQHGSMSVEGGFQAEDALSDVLGSRDKKNMKNKETLALMDKDRSDEEEEEEEGEEPNQVSAKAALNKAVEDAEVLSDLGKSKSKDQAAKRVLKMVKVIKDVKKQADSAGQKILGAALAELEKLSKKGTSLNLESCKDTLLDAVLAVKKVQKGAKN